MAIFKHFARKSSEEKQWATIRWLQTYMDSQPYSACYLEKLYFLGLFNSVVYTFINSFA